jgi:N6-adenosine-specific RNA methylase IME4
VRSCPVFDTRTRYPVIYADPPWRFEPYSRKTGMDRAADSHYGTMTLEEICALPVRELAADDAILYLWATVPMLPEALKVIEVWGFTYRSNFSWHKDKCGTGYWNRNQHEHLLVATRGRIPAPAPGARVSSVIEAPRGRHSAKPDAAYEMIEDAFPDLPRIELFARARRDGWAAAWGNELGAEMTEP